MIKNKLIRFWCPVVSQRLLNFAATITTTATSSQPARLFIYTYGILPLYLRSHGQTFHMQMDVVGMA